MLEHWLGRGVAGWRLDSAWSAPVGFWRTVLARVRERYPTAWFLGQVFDDDLPPVVNSATYSSATGYGLMHGVREWLAGGSADRMAATLRVHAGNCTRTSPHTFLGNHDFARLADAVPPTCLPAAFAILLTLPGIPAVYYGDEIAATSTWSRSGSDAVLRPPLAPQEVDRLSGTPRDLLAAVRGLGVRRRASTWITSARLHDVSVRGDRLSYVVAGGNRSIEVLIDRRAGTWRIDRY